MKREIRAWFEDDSIRVYQAFSSQIANAAKNSQKFVQPFKLNRMTWIKPSFKWMMCRSGWGEKIGQERILEISISRTGFDVVQKYVNEWILHIEDVTQLSKRIHKHVQSGRIDLALSELPPERVYPLDQDIEIKLGIR